jgi:alkaline phosphatase
VELDIARRAAGTQMFSMNKKTRNRLLALGCLLVFLALGGLFYINWVVQRPFAVIVFLADNLTPSVLTPARNYQGGADHRLQIEKFPNIALVTTHANDFAVPDAAAAASSIATGQKGNNGMLGVNAGKGALPTLVEIARQRGRATGIVSNASITDATAAAFYAETSDPLDYPVIACQLVESQVVDVIMGGGAADFVSDGQGGRRNDARDLIQEMRDKGYDVVRSESELEGTPSWRSPKTLGLFSMGNLNFADEFAAEAGQPSLSTMVRNAIRLLQYNARGYLLIVDAGLAGKSAAQNEGERTLREILALDDAVAEAVRYAGPKALILVVGKRNVGGLRLNGYPFRNDKGVGLLGINAQGAPSISWSTGPESGTRTSPEGPVSTEPAASKRAAAIGVAEDAIAVGSGPGTEALRGFQDNTEIFRIVQKEL